jgi:hypothetical protein
MPSETSDIKQFLEIARRKDAKCTTPIPNSLSSLTIIRPYSFLLLMRYPPLTFDLSLHSCTNQEEHQDERDQVQDPMQPLPLHPQAEGLGQGGQIKAELTSW